MQTTAKPTFFDRARTRLKNAATSFLAFSARINFLSGMRASIYLGADVDAKIDSDGNTILHTTAHERVATVLLTAKANIDARNNNGLTPLQTRVQAIRNSYYHYPVQKDLLSRFIHFLIQNNADVNVQNTPGNDTLLHTLIRNLYTENDQHTKDVYHEIIKMLTAKGARTDIANAAGVTALQEFVKADMKHEQHRYTLSIAAELFKNELNPNVSQSFNFGTIRYSDYMPSALEYAATFCNKTFVAVIAQLWGQNNVKQAFKFAVLNKNQDALDALMEAEVKETHSDQQSKNYLHHAVETNNPALTALANYSPEKIAYVDSNNKTPLDYAVDTDDLGLIETLAKLSTRLKFASSAPLHYAVEHGSANAIRIVAENTLDVDAVDLNGNTALHLAAQKGDLNTVNLLLSRNANPSKPNKDGLPPLYLAAQATENVDAIMEKLMAAGANVNQEVIDPNCRLTGVTLLHIAATKESTATKNLIKHGANVNAKDASVLASDASCDHGRTPLHYAATANILTNILTLLANDAQSYPDSAGDLPITEAIEHKNPVAVSALIKATQEAEAKKLEATKANTLVTQKPQGTNLMTTFFNDKRLLSLGTFSGLLAVAGFAARLSNNKPSF